METLIGNAKLIETRCVGARVAAIKISSGLVSESAMPDVISDEES